MKDVPVVVLREYSYVRASLCRLHVPSVFSGRAGFDVGAHRIFPQGVLAPVTLVGGVAADGGARTCTRYEMGLLWSLNVTTLSGVGFATEWPKQNPGSSG